MKNITRRDFVTRSVATCVAAALPRRIIQAAPYSRVRGANDDIRVAVVGFRSHGKSHINSFRQLPGVRVVALCDADRDVLDWGVRVSKARNEKVDAYVDVRKLLEDKNIDVVSTATPNHWHSLVTVWACQAGKDVCVEKPVSHNIFEGRKMVEAARKYKRVVQAGTESRANVALQEAVRYIQQGSLGKILLAYGFCHKRRKSMGKVNGPQPIPKSVDYNLWTGPATLMPLMRKNLHYDWHWVWATGCGEVGNNGPHQLDICRWILGQPKLPPRVMSIGGRFGYDDDGETPNTHIAVLGYEPAPIIYQARGLPTETGDSAMDVFRAVSSTGAPIRSGRESPSPNTGVVIQCEHGYFEQGTLAAYDNDGKLIREFTGESSMATNVSHDANFIQAVRSRKIGELNAEILEGHLSTALSHMANISHRLGKRTSRDRVKEVIAGNRELSDAFERFEEHLRANGVSLMEAPATLGPLLKMDPDKERFVGSFAAEANMLVARNYREPFVVPENV
ncbi:MAG: Gfo/Idh/MocA family oxidoreductase [Phycisphaerales bacterium]|nr:MAG: Gfo/Idh/MocA family oxidoreductase [Phycisphaerales bacterium]